MVGSSMVHCFCSHPLVQHSLCLLLLPAHPLLVVPNYFTQSKQNFRLFLFSWIASLMGTPFIQPQQLIQLLRIQFSCGFKVPSIPFCCQTQGCNSVPDIQFAIPKRSDTVLPRLPPKYSSQSNIDVRSAVCRGCGERRKGSSFFQSMVQRIVVVQAGCLCCLHGVGG